MCGIVGLFLKDRSLEPRLGELSAGMLATMCERGPDSAGFAVYGAAQAGRSKITLQSPDPDKDFAGLGRPSRQGARHQGRPLAQVDARGPERAVGQGRGGARRGTLARARESAS